MDTFLPTKRVCISADPYCELAGVISLTKNLGDCELSKCSLMAYSKGDTEMNAYLVKARPHRDSSLFP